MKDILTTIIWAAIIQGIILGSIYLFSKKHRSRSNAILGFFLLSLMAEAIGMFSSLEEIVGFPLIEYFGMPETKIFWPLLFFHYILEKLGISSKYRLFLKINYVIAFTFLSLTPVNIVLFMATGLTFAGVLDLHLLNWVYMGQQYYAFLVAVFAVTVSIRETLRYRTLARNEYSDLGMLRINWLWQFIFTLIPVILLWGAELGRIILGGTGESTIVLAIWGLIVLFIYFVSFQAFRHPNLFEGVRRVESEPTNAIPPRSGKKPHGTEKETNHAELIQRLNQLMHQNSYYRDHRLTLHDLSKTLEIPARSISSCVNSALGVSFSDWVNSFRVEEALSMLKDPANQHLSIEGIGSEAGFNSRSAMYTAFKRKTGNTPGQIREAMLS
jgi:AraC-like DNA-binding protein